MADHDTLQSLFGGAAASASDAGPAPAQAPAPAASDDVSGIPRIRVTPLGPAERQQMFEAASRGLSPLSGSAEARALSEPSPGMSGADTAADVAKSAGIGVVKGTIGLAGMQGDSRELTSRIASGIASKFGVDVPPDHIGMVLGMLPYLSGPSSSQLRQPIESVTGPLYQPKTGAGELAQTAGELAPNALMGPGGAARRIVGNVLVPAVTTEIAGQATRQVAPELEPYARVIGGATGAVGSQVVGSALERATNSAGKVLANRLSSDITPDVIERAHQLMIASQQGPHPIPLTVPEALSKVAGRPVLQDEMRILEAQPQTRDRMQQFFGRRPGQIAARAEAEAGAIAPAPLLPSKLGPAASQDARSILGDIRERINAEAQPYYDRADAARLNPDDAAYLLRDAGYQANLRELRNHPVIGPATAHLPDDSVAMADLVKKLNDGKIADSAGQLNSTAIERLAEAYRTRTNARVVSAADRATGSIPEMPENGDFLGHAGVAGDYEAARLTVQELRAKFLDPLTRPGAPLERLAKSDVTTQNAINALWPKNPLADSETEIHTAVALLAMKSPLNAEMLVRQYVRGVMNDSARVLQSGGANQWVGGKFFVNIAGSEQQMKNLQASIEALPGGQATFAGFKKFLDLVEATGLRQTPGSKTAFNAQEQAALGDTTGNAAASLARTVTSPMGTLSMLDRAWSRWHLGRNLNQIADILTTPEGMATLKQIASAKSQSQVLALSGRLLAQSSELNDGSRPPANVP